MIKSELIETIALANTHVYERDIERIVNAILDGISDAMARGDRVELRGFGSFSIRTSNARSGRNPKTGEFISISAKCRPFFRPAKELRARLNRENVATASEPTPLPARLENAIQNLV